MAYIKHFDSNAPVFANKFISERCSALWNDIHGTLTWTQSDSIHDDMPIRDWGGRSVQLNCVKKSCSKTKRMLHKYWYHFSVMEKMETMTVHVLKLCSYLSSCLKNVYVALHTHPPTK